MSQERPPLASKRSTPKQMPAGGPEEDCAPTDLTNSWVCGNVPQLGFSIKGARKRRGPTQQGSGSVGEASTPARNGIREESPRFFNSKTQRSSGKDGLRVEPSVSFVFLFISEAPSCASVLLRYSSTGRDTCRTRVPHHQTTPRMFLLSNSHRPTCLLPGQACCTPSV